MNVGFTGTQRGLMKLTEAEKEKLVVYFWGKNISADAEKLVEHIAAALGTLDDTKSPSGRGAVSTVTNILRVILIIVVSILIIVHLWPRQSTIPAFVITPAAPALTAEYTLDELSEEYRIYNLVFFNKKLPGDVIFQFGPAFLINKSQENLATTSYNKLTGRYTIEINPKYDVAMKHADGSLLHEMCHIATWDESGHGPEWNECMDRIDKEHAFDNLR